MWFQPLSDRLSGVISLCSHACSKYLTLPTLLLSWPLTSIHTAMFPAQGQPAVSAAEKWAVIHNPPHHLPEAIDFCFPNLQKRSRGKIKNTVSLELNKDGERERERDTLYTLKEILHPKNYCPFKPSLKIRNVEEYSCCCYNESE